MIEHTHPFLGEEELAAAERVLRSGRLAQGAEVAAFEDEFSNAVGSEHAIAVANGTVAIEIGLQALGIGRGDEVVVPSFTFIATANAVRRVGAVPVFADIDPKTYCVSAATVEPRLGSRTKAVIAVHLYGHPADMDALSVLCEETGVHLLEDAAQGIGASWRERSVGSFGTFATFSLYATKNVTTGEGGMITTSDDRVADVARSLRTHESRTVHERLQVASNARMTEVEAAIGRVQLSRIGERQQRRHHLAHTYEQRLDSRIATPYVAPEAVHGFHQYTIRTLQRTDIKRSLEERQVGYGIYYAIPVHLRETYRDTPVSLPDTEAAANEVMSLPIRPDLTDAEQETVIAAVNGALDP
ncbi:MAG: DegT/DnrJ/EryC1/StrS family aminotransferase [Actinomycetota bacterium]|nr:DegT/DnrJ/EryC1/StrS family aminotransferase [Actinomycetota bacterium]